MDYLAKRVAPGIPMWDLTDENDTHIGVATDFTVASGCIADEGPMVTVRSVMDFLEGGAATFVGVTVRQALAFASAYLRDAEAALKAEADAEYFSEVIGPMIAAERAAEARYDPRDDDPVW